MSITGNYSRILPGRVKSEAFQKPSVRVVNELVALSENDYAISELSRKIFARLRKCLGSQELNINLKALQYLAYKGDLAGVRLLAAYLDVTTAGARLIPYLRKFNHTRRQLIFLDNISGDLDDVAGEWRIRARRLIATCHAFPGLDKSIIRNAQNTAPCLQAVLEKLLSEVVQEEGITAENRDLLVGLLRLETDAWQERISRLAGTVNPFRISAIQRLLPMLNRADTNIRDIRQLISWVKEGQDRNAFIRHGSRALEVLEEQEFATIFKVLRSDDDLKLLADLHTGGQDNPAPLVWLGTAVARLLALDYDLVNQGYEATELDLLSAVYLVQQNTRGSVLAIPLSLEQENSLQALLAAPVDRNDNIAGRGSWLLEGLSVEAGQLVLTLPAFNEELAPWPHGLPSNEDIDPSRPLSEVLATQNDHEKDGDGAPVMDGSTIKKLVFENITSTSVLLGFLRNPKVIAVPGLVSAVASRTRNPQIIETIASDRALHTGFANRDVPLICLTSPCNVSPKVLRKFIHVKYVSKVDLRRIAADRSGIRKEVIREVELYLDVLG